MDYLSQKIDKLSLEGVYKDTNYIILDPEISIVCDSRNEDLDQFMRKLGKRSWTFISAANPRSKVESAKINAWKNTNLEIDIAKSGLHYAYAVGEASSGDWPSEPSFVVFDLALDAAMDLAKKYDQNAILVGRIDGIARLEWT